MTNAEIALKIRDAIYERSDDEGGAISREQMDEAIEEALDKMQYQSPPTVTGGVCVDGVWLAPGCTIHYVNCYGTIGAE